MALHKCLVPELVEQLVEVLKWRYQDGIQQPTAKRVVEVPKISCQEYIEALEGVSQERVSEEKFEMHKIAHPERILEKDSAQIGVPRVRVQQRRAEQEILEIFENFPLERISERTQIVDGPVPQIAKETPGVVGLALRIRAKPKLHKKPRETCKSSWSPTGNLKSFTLTIPWNLAKPVKISPGITALLHHTDRRQMGLLKEQCAE